MANNSTNNQARIIQLREERDRLRQKLATIEADFRKGLAQDSEDQAIELENAEVLEEIARVTAEELAKIDERLSELV